MWAGRLADAEAACRSLLGRALDPSVENTVRVCLGNVLLAGDGRAPEGLCELERACQSPLLTGPEQAEAQAWASFARQLMGDLEGAAATAGEARSAAASVRDHVAMSIAMATLALNALVRGHLPEALQIADDAVRLADQSPGRKGHRIPVHIPRGYILLELDRLEEARTTIETGMRISEELGTRWGFAHYHLALAMERFRTGNWDDAVAEIETDTGPAG